MQPVSLKKGTLVTTWPNNLVAKTKKFQARENGSHWAARLLDAEGKTLIVGAGTYTSYEGRIQVSGSQVEALPAWWDDGEEMRPESWQTAQVFGVSSEWIPIGED